MGEPGTPRTRPELIAALAAGYPRFPFSRETIGWYVRSLSDVPVSELEEALQVLARTHPRFDPPTVAEIRATVAERRLRLLGPEAAWEAAWRWSTTLRRSVVCPDCGGSGWTDAGEETACARCHGNQTVVEKVPSLDATTARALENVGGNTMLRSLEKPEDLRITRGQFIRAYTAFRAEAIREVALGALALPAVGPRRELGEGASSDRPGYPDNRGSEGATGEGVHPERPDRAQAAASG